jgi:hypothetical protein
MSCALLARRQRRAVPVLRFLRLCSGAARTGHPAPAGGRYIPVPAPCGLAPAHQAKLCKSPCPAAGELRWSRLAFDTASLDVAARLAGLNESPCVDTVELGSCLCVNRNQRFLFCPPV